MHSKINTVHCVKARCVKLNRILHVLINPLGCFDSEMMRLDGDMMLCVCLFAVVLQKAKILQSTKEGIVSSVNSRTFQEQ